MHDGVGSALVLQCCIPCPAVVSTLGACACYCLARVAGRGLVHALWPQRLHSFAAEVKRRKQHLLNYIVFLRVTPILPNTFVNVASPIVDMPLSTFAAGTCLCACKGHAGCVA